MISQTARGAAPTGSDSTQLVPVLLLWLAGLGAAAQYAKVAVVFELLPTLYPAGGASLGLTVSLVGIVGILLGVAAGMIVGRIGMRRAMIWGLAAGAVLSLAQAMVPPLWLFFVLRVAEGASHLLLVVAAPTLIAQLSAPAHRGMTLTLWSTFFGVAFAVLVFAGLPLVAWGGVPALFAGHGIWMAICALLLWAVLPPDPPGEASAWPGPALILCRSVQIYRSPWIGAPAIGWLFYTFSFVSLLTLLPPFLPPDLRAPVIGAMPLVSIAASMSAGVWLLRYVSAVAVAQVGFFIAAALALALAFAPGSALLCLLIAAALGLTQGASFAAVPELNAEPEERVLANGGLAQMGNVGNTVGVPVLAGCIALFGHGGLMLPVALMLALGGIAHQVLAARRR